MERLKCKAAFEEALKYIPGGVNSPVRALRAVGETPLFIKKAKGLTLTDIDDNNYMDLCLSWGVHLLGHCNPKIDEAARQAISLGSSYGIPHLGETVMAKWVNSAFPNCDKVRFVNSGTEATMSAIRLARGYTGRDIIVKFEGCYHGHADHLLVAAGSGVARISGASSAGVPKGFTEYTVCLPYNDVESLNDYFKQNGKKVAAIIVEPVACNMGVVVPTEEFITRLRTITQEYGALLIFDEVITGFRLAFGGAAERFGISPDMSTVGKIVGGGYPTAAFGGKAEIMAMLAPEGPVYQAGTLSGNPVAMAAGNAVMEQISAPGFYNRLESNLTGYFAELEKIVAKHGYQLNHIGSMYTIFFSHKPVKNFADAKACDTEKFAEYFRKMLQRGVYVSPSQFEGNFLSSLTTPSDLEFLLKNIDECLD